MQPERKHKDYQPFPGLYDLRLFDLNSKQFEAAWRVQECLYRGEYYRQFDPGRWTMFQDMSARLQMLILPLKKRP